MKCKGEITGLSLNWQTKKPEVTLALDANAEDLERLQDKQLSVEIKRYRQKRSLDANAYYWILVTMISDVLKTSASYTHNELIRRYGQVETVDGKLVYVVIPDTDEAARDVDQAETVHLKPTPEVKEGNDGEMYRTYIMMRGSHTYNTKEMSTLIDGTIGEAKELGIETLTPDQQREMMAAYEQNYKQKYPAE